MRRDAASSALIVLLLALGIGGNTAIFTLIKATLLDPLPYAAPEALVRLVGRIPDRRVQGQVNRIDPTASEFLEIRNRSRVLESVAFLDQRDFQLIGADEPLRILAARVSVSFFPLLGIQPALGRGFSSEEEGAGRAATVILSHDFWTARMGANPDIVGKPIRLNDSPYVVIGVLPRDFRFDYANLRGGEPAEVYVPFPFENSSSANSGVTHGQSAIVDRGLVLGRIPAGSGAAELAAELDSIAKGLYPPETAFPGQAGDRAFQAQSLREVIVRNQRPLLWFLMSGAGLLLLIACANTAQLLLARSLRRTREVAIRAALGASRARLIRQFLVEGLMMAACGGVIGLLLSRWTVALLLRRLPGRNLVIESARMDSGVLAFTLGLSTVCALLFAILPAVKGTAWMPGTHLNSRVVIGRGNRWRHVMISIEAALSIFVLCTAGLIVQNLWVLVSSPSGFDPRDVLIMRMQLPAPREQTNRVSQEYLRNVSGIPGVHAAAIATSVPLRPGNAGFNRFVGEPRDAALNRPPTWTYFVSADYFTLLSIPLVAGRRFGEEDRLGRPTVAIVNQEFVRTHGIASSPVGHEIDDGPGGTITIVGVVGDVRLRGVQTSPQPQIYLPYPQFLLPNVYLLVRSQIEPGQLLNRIKPAIRSVNPDQPVFNVLTMDQAFSNSIAGPRFNAVLVTMFAFLALLIVACGMYSVIACLVSQRTNEIALRIALGANRFSVARNVLGTTSAWVFGGLSVGLVFALAGAGTVSRLMSTISPGTLPMYAIVLVLFVVVTLSAVIVPLRRALRLEPLLALRHE